jgi:hypothetical protein
MTTGRYGHTATLLHTGQVLVVGGYRSTYLASAELYDPRTRTWTATDSLHVARSWHVAACLSHVGVLVVGGYGVPSVGYIRSAEVWSTA